METTQYYDPLYGQVDLPDVLISLINQGVVLRLQQVGLMNYRSINKLSLTSITRLEHSIGTAILTSEMSKQNSALRANYNEYICAGLYHDINCASFGHAVEWAISKFGAFDHVEQTRWFDDDKSTIKQDKPIVKDGNQSDFIDKEILKKYHIEPKVVKDIIQGNKSCVINSKTMDLDNIDNVCRMALYMGLDFDRKLPLVLSRSLELSHDPLFFQISNENLHLVEKWIELRKKVYSKFIYSQDYFGYEFLIFEMISSLYRLFPDIAKIVKNMTDERLLNFAEDNGNQYTKSIVKQLRNYKLPSCIAIISSDNFSSLDLISNEENYLKLKEEISEVSKFEGIDLDVTEFEIHTTTDKFKTGRSVQLYCDGELTRIGKDKRKVLFGLILTRDELPRNADKLAHIMSLIIDSTFGSSDIENNFYQSNNLSLF